MIIMGDFLTTQLGKYKNNHERVTLSFLKGGIFSPWFLREWKGRYKENLLEPLLDKNIWQAIAIIFQYMHFKRIEYVGL